MTIMYKIVNNLTPPYLKSLLPPDRDHNYETRSTGTLPIPPLIRKNFFLKSFLPSTIKLWNKLDKDIRKSKNIDTFKYALKTQFFPKKCYRPHLEGFSRAFLNLNRIRLGLSGLNAHRKKYHFIPRSTCPKCNFRLEDTSHFLFVCPSYAAHREAMIAEITRVLPNTEELFGNPTRKNLKTLVDITVNGTKDKDIDRTIFKTIATYINKTKWLR